MTPTRTLSPTLVNAVLDRLGRRFRFQTEPGPLGTIIEAQDLRLHVLGEGDEYTVIFEPSGAGDTPIHVAARATELEAILRELLAS